MADLVRGDEADEVAHQLVVIDELAGARIHGAGLHLVPVVHQGHHVMIPADVAFEDLAGTGVVDIGSIGVRRGGGEVADDGETGVLHAHVRVVLRPFLGVDGVLPACLLEGLLPVIDTGNQVRPPLFRGGRIDVIHNRFDRFHELAALLLFHVFRTGFQAPAGDEADALNGLLLIGILRVTIGKITHAGIEQTRLHRLFRKEDHRRVEDERDHAGLGTRGQGVRPGGRTRRRGIRCVVREGLGHRHLRVDGIGADALDEAGVALEAAQVVGPLLRAAERKWLIVTL